MDKVQASPGPVVPANILAAARMATLKPQAQKAREIEKAATGFESLFLSMLMKEMRESLEPGTLFPEDSGDVLGNLFDSYMGQHLAEGRGALGIAPLVRQQLARTLAQETRGAK